MKLLRHILISIVVLFMIVILSWKSLLPRIAAKAVVSEELIEMVPEPYRDAAIDVQKNVDSGIGALPELMERHNLTFDELLRLAESTETSDIIPLVEYFKSNPEVSADDAFEQINEQFGHKVENPEIFREAFRERYDKKRIYQALRALEASDLPLDVNIELARRIAIEVLKERREEIESELTRIQSGQK